MGTWKIDHYRLVHRSQVVGPQSRESLLLDGFYAWFPSEHIGVDMAVRSDCGILEMTGNNPLVEYEHSGRTILINNSGRSVVFHYLLAIPIPFNP